MKELLNQWDICTTIEMKRYVFEQIYMNKEKCVNQKHKYAITQNANTLYWQTYVTGIDGKRKLIRKKEKEALYDALCAFYFPAPVTTTLAKLYPLWLEHKEKTTSRSTTIYRIDTDWIRFYLNDPISSKILQKDICLITKREILEWMCYLIKKYNMTQKTYNNMSIIPRSIFTFAYDNEMLDINYFEKVKIPSHYFVRNDKPDSSSQVFTQEEQTQLCDTAISEYYNRGQNVFLFNIPLIFLTGLRIGEILALKWEDIHGNELYVHDSVMRDLVRSDTGWLPATYNIHPSLKRNAKPRKIPLTPIALKLLTEIKAHYERNGENPTYIFEKNGKLATEGAMGKLWTRLCKKINILPRSPHKGRKTFISTLIDYQLPIHFICQVSGHADEQTTFKHYCFTRDTKDELNDKMNQALTFTSNN